MFISFHAEWRLTGGKLSARAQGSAGKPLGDGWSVRGFHVVQARVEVHDVNLKNRRHPV